MNNLLSKLLKKWDVKDFSELSPEEKVQFEQLRKQLSKDELTLNDLREFCEMQLQMINVAFRDLDLEPRKQDKLIAQHAVYSALLHAIDSPKLEREAAERYLTGLLE